MLTSRRRYLGPRGLLLAGVLLGICLLVSAFASATLAAGPAAVTVRIEGLSETRLLPTPLTTTTAPVVKDGNAEHACTGTSAAGALQLATNGNWSGPWNSQYKQYEIYSIEGESHLFESGAAANYYWSFWLDEKESSTGPCETELQPGDRVLFFPACYGSACPPAQTPLGIEAPSSGSTGEAFTVTVRKYSSSGAASPVSGASVSEGSATATTDAGGHATLTVAQTGDVTLRASASESVRTEATVCVHNGNDGNCGTTAPTTTTSTATTPLVIAPPKPYTGPYAVVAHVGGLLDGHAYAAATAPRVLAGTVAAASPVASVSLELRREYRGRCYAYDGARERFRVAHCGTGSFFKVSGNGVFNYQLSSALRPGRYVLDVKASDAAGNRTTLSRGSSRVVFYVR